MLTPKQHELLLFIHRHLSETGVSPSFEEMKQAVGLKSKSGIHRLIGALEERRFLRRLPNRARALEVLRLPADAAATADGGDIVDMAQARTRQRRAAPGLRPADNNHADAPVQLLPLVGRIAAGLPIEAIEDHEELAVPAALLGGGEHYVLQVSGDSMIDAGIFDGDFAIIRKTEDARDGEIVVALIDSAEATLKYLHRDKGMVRLDPANRLYESQSYLPSRVRIQGCLAGLLRRY